jgi:flavin-binding protein dodecin
MVYKYFDIMGTSATGLDDAIKNAIEEAAKTIKIYNGLNGLNGLNWAVLQ